jgi:hypothetical protein
MATDIFLDKPDTTIESGGDVSKSTRMDPQSITQLLVPGTRPPEVTEEGFQEALADIVQRSYVRTVVNFSGSLPGGPRRSERSFARKLLQTVERLLGYKSAD